MPDIIDATGLQVQSASEITAALVSGLQLIYGADINVAQNSKDGQVIGILTQMAVDVRELLVAVNNSFDPDQAVGVLLDERVALNNIQRAGGTYTAQPIDITVSTTVTLQGLDANFNNPNGSGYTVQDGSGNQFILVDSATLTVGTSTHTFRAQQIGNVNVPIDTIVNPVTIILGVTSVNNSSAAISIGQDEETDAQLRTRRQSSVAIASSGYLNGLLGTVLALTGVVAAAIHENVTNVTDANGIPAHGIWLIVDGGANTDIGNAIYTKISYGANMKGAVAVSITTASGDVFIALFDRPAAETLYIEFNIQPTTTVTDFDSDAIKQYIVTNKIYTIGQYADTASLTAVAQAAINAGAVPGVVTDLKISIDDSTWVDYLTPAVLNNEFTLATANIAITVI